MRAALIVLAFASILSLTHTAAAGGPPGLSAPEQAAPQPTTRVERYGTQVALADLAWLATSVLLTSNDDASGAGGTVASLGYLGAGPLVHLIHGNTHGALKSFGARLLLPVGGALLGLVIAAGLDDPDPACADSEYPCDEFGGPVFLAVGLGAFTGFATALVLDWTVFARKRVEVPAGGLALQPGLGVTRDGVTVSLGGSF